MESRSLDIGLGCQVQLALFHRVAADAQQITNSYGAPWQQWGG